MELNRRGRNRFVLLTRRYAFKFPSLRCWQDFLYGLLNNMNEVRRSNRFGACPVCWSIPGGFLVVMPRVATFNKDEFLKHGSMINVIRMELCSAENKPDSFGLLDGKVVCVDYGWPP